MKLLSCAVVLMLLYGCGGFRGGIESVPYVGEAIPQENPSHPSWLHEIALPEVTLQLSLNNAIRTYQYEVMLYVIPIYLNFWDEFRNQHADALELSLQLTAHDSPVLADPRQLMLIVDGHEVRPNGVWIDNREREREVIDAFVKARRQSPPDQSPAIPRASEWRDAVTDPVTLGPRERSPYYIVTFPLPLQSPEKNLTLNLIDTILGPRRSQPPLIRFKSMRWSAGYS
jgi:hypothetical protein